MLPRLILKQVLWPKMQAGDDFLEQPVRHNDAIRSQPPCGDIVHFLSITLILSLLLQAS